MATVRSSSLWTLLAVRVMCLAMGRAIDRKYAGGCAWAVGASGGNSINGCNGLLAEETATNGELDGLHDSVREYWSDVSYGNLNIASNYDVYSVSGNSTFVVSLVGVF